MSPEVVGGRRGVSGDGAGAGAGAGVSAGGGGAGSRWGGGFATGLAQPASKARSSRGRRWRSILPSLTSVESRLNDNPVSPDIDLPGPFPYIRALPVEPRTPPSARPRSKVMKVRSSLKSLKTRHRDCKLVRRKGVVYIINKTNPRFKAKQG